MIELRSAALEDPDLILNAIAELGPRDARRLYTGRLVDQALARVYRVSARTVVRW